MESEKGQILGGKMGDTKEGREVKKDRDVQSGRIGEIIEELIEGIKDKDR